MWERYLVTISNKQKHPGDIPRGAFMFHVKHYSQSSSQVTNSRPALLVALVMMIAKSSPSMRETMSAKSRWKVGEME